MKKRERHARLILTCAFSVILLCGWTQNVARAEEDNEVNPGFIQKLKDGFSWDLRIMPYGIVQEPSDSTQNPDNNFLEFPHYTANLELRPDFRQDLDPLYLSAKPRAKFEYDIWKEGLREGDTDWDRDTSLNEWLARFKARDNLFVSYGRENLQWGPSFLFSPSNPFFLENGRSNPFVELPGMDFGRIVWIPDSSWTASFIVNTDEGRNTVSGPDSFEKIYALKVDYVGSVNYASVIFSQKDFKETLGLYSGWTVTDAILLYGEGSIARGSDALYPKYDASPLGASMQKTHHDCHDAQPIVLAGSSYTIEGSGTLSLEYAYNSPGYTDSEAETYFELRQRGAEAFDMGGQAGMLGAMTLAQTVNPGLRFLRKNYAVLQYTQTNIRNRMEVFARLTRNLDDGSGLFTAYMTYSLGNHFEVFALGVVSMGGRDTEFRSLLDYHAMLGVKYTM